MPETNGLTLREKQSVFVKLLARLIDRAYSLGYELTLGEAHRPAITARYYDKIGIGILSSLHRKRLAIDLNLFLEGEYLTDTESWRLLGEWWEEQSTDEYECSWGGTWGDGNHFSIAHDGRR